MTFSNTVEVWDVLPLSNDSGAKILIYVEMEYRPNKTTKLLSLFLSPGTSK